MLARAPKGKPVFPAAGVACPAGRARRSGTAAAVGDRHGLGIRYLAVTIADIVRPARVSRAAFYAHFADKETAPGRDRRRPGPHDRPGRIRDTRSQAGPIPARSRRSRCASNSHAVQLNSFRATVMRGEFTLHSARAHPPVHSRGARDDTPCCVPHVEAADALRVAHRNDDGSRTAGLHPAQSSTVKQLTLMAPARCTAHPDAAPPKPISLPSGSQ